MRTDIFDFELPEELIALRPRTPREAARLLVVRADGISHATIGDLPDILPPGTHMVMNDTRVLPARLEGTRPKEGLRQDVAVSVNLIRRTAPDRYGVLLKPARRLRNGDTIRFHDGLSAIVHSLSEGAAELAFNRQGAALDEAIAGQGRMPLPPYIAQRRPADRQDETDYQTIYGRETGSVAAPTAGLHFTPALLARLAEKKVTFHTLTLHVGAGTFQPVRAEDTADHQMHPEWARLSGDVAAALNTALGNGDPLLAVGTTSLRTLESAASADGLISAFEGETSLFATPGYRFRTADMLLTNFHLPRSTLFMLVSAFMGLETMQTAYAEAIRQRYRFYSYGDACLLIRSRG